MSARDAIESLLERPATPSQLAHQLMSFFAGRLEISRPELTRLALGLSLSDPEPPQWHPDPSTVYEAFKPGERSIPIRVRVLFGDGTWRMWASLIRLHAESALADRELVDCFTRHWERGLVMLRQDWQVARSTDGLLGRLLKKATEGQTNRPTPHPSGLTVTTRACSWKRATSAPRHPAETGQIVITANRPVSPPAQPWRSFIWPTPTRLPLRPFVCLPNEQPDQAAKRIVERLQLTPAALAASVLRAFERHLKSRAIVDLDAVMHDLPGGDAHQRSPIEDLARLHLFGSRADSADAFDLHHQPWLIDLSALAARRRPLVLRTIALGIETLAHEWQSAQPGDKLRVMIFADEEAARSLPHNDDHRLGIAWRRLQTGAAGSSM